MKRNLSEEIEEIPEKNVRVQAFSFTPSDGATEAFIDKDLLKDGPKSTNF